MSYFSIVRAIGCHFGVANVTKAAKVASNPFSVIFVLGFKDDVDETRANKCCRKLYVVSFAFLV